MVLHRHSVVGAPSLAETDLRGREPKPLFLLEARGLPTATHAHRLERPLTAGEVCYLLSVPGVFPR